MGPKDLSASILGGDSTHLGSSLYSATFSSVTLSKLLELAELSPLRELVVSGNGL